MKGVVRIILKFFSIVSILTLIISCSVSQNIQVHSDGTASVEQYYDKTTDERSFDYYAESPNVVELKTSEASIPPDFAEMTLKVDPIDSLGFYLTDFKPGFLTFTKEQNHVIISLSGSEPSFWNSNLKVYMRIEFDQKISSVISNDIKVKRDGENAIEIFRTRRQLKNKGLPTEIKVILKDEQGRVHGTKASLALKSHKWAL